MKNKKAKQMICSVLKVKVEKLHTGVYDFAFINGEIGYWVNRVGPITKLNNKTNLQ